MYVHHIIIIIIIIITRSSSVTDACDDGNKDSGVAMIRGAHPRQKDLVSTVVFLALKRWGGAILGPT